MKYEYLIKSKEEMHRSKERQFGVSTGRYALAANINELGSDGWRLVIVVDDLYHFERGVDDVVVTQINGQHYAPVEGYGLTLPARPFPTVQDAVSGERWAIGADGLTTVGTDKL
jgi:hypothetical protein